MAHGELALFPVLSVLFALLAFFIGYAIAVSKGHVDAFLPFISDCAAIQPESSIFGQLFNISAFFLAVTVFLIHRQTMLFHARDYENNIVVWRIFSIILMLIGFVAALGASIVSNFQEGPQLVTHNTGAFMLFIGIVVYFWGQTIMSCGLRPRMIPLRVICFRVLINLIVTALLAFHMTCLFGEPFVKSVNGTKPVEDVPPTGIVRHKQGDPFYVNWLATTISEWVLALLIEFYVLTYAYDLSRNFMSSTKGSHCSSVIDGHLKRMSYEPPVDHGYPEQFSSAGAYFGTPSRRRLYRVDQVYASSGYNPPRALPRTMIAPTSNGDRYQYF
ncbi:hypothetical protein V3C99_017402 [Haemonchus contortus]